MSRCRKDRAGERGSATVLVLGLGLVVLTVSGYLVQLTHQALMRSSLQGQADLAALSAAYSWRDQRALGRTAHSFALAIGIQQHPCDIARQSITQPNIKVACTLEGAAVTVTLTANSYGRTIEVHSRAGSEPY